MDEGSLSDTQRTMVLPLLQETNIRGKPYITVSAKGIVNGLSRYPNDGADFGPDTTLGATAPGQYGSPYTETCGINEGGNYLSQPITSVDGGPSPQGGGKIILKDPMTYQISAPIVIKPFTSGNSFAVIIEGVAWKRTGTQICPSSSFPTSSYLLTISGGTGSLQVGFILKNFILNGGIGGAGINLTPYASGLLISNGSYGTIDSVTYENCVVARNFSIGTDGTAHISGIAASSEIFVNYQTGIIYYYGGVLTSNPSFYPRDQTSVAVQEYGQQNVEYLNPLMYAVSGSVFPVFMQIYPTDYKSIKISNLFYIGLYPSSGTYPIIQAYTTNTPEKISVFIDSCILVQQSSVSGAAPQLIQTVNSTGTSSVYHFFVSGLAPFLSSFVVLNSNSGNRTHLIASDSYFSDVGSLVLTEGSNFFANFYNCLGLPAPTISANPPVSGTAYQNTNPYDIRLKIPVTYNPTTTAAATLATGISSTSTVTTTTKVSIPSGLTAADGQILTYDMVVPAGLYFELVATNATIGTVEVQAA
jgi:hypothetical protein